MSGVRADFKSEMTDPLPRLSQQHSLAQSDSVKTLTISTDASKNEILLGAGASARIFKGSYKHKPVAIKLFNENPQRNNQIALLRELSFIVRFNLPSILVCVGVAMNPPALLLDLKAKTLDKFIEEQKATGKPFEFQIILKILIQIAEAICTLHKAGVIHKDIKPSNILLDEKNDAVLSDFGTACDQKDHTGLNKFKGTYNYIAPELFQIKVRDGAKLDVYSFGLIMAEMFLIDINFEGIKNPKFQKLNRDFEARIIRKILAIQSCPREFSNLVMLALRANPLARPSMEGILESLRLMQSKQFKPVAVLHPRAELPEPDESSFHWIFSALRKIKELQPKLVNPDPTLTDLAVIKMACKKFAEEKFDDADTQSAKYKKSKYKKYQIMTETIQTYECDALLFSKSNQETIAQQIGSLVIEFEAGFKYN